MGRSGCRNATCSGTPSSWPRDGTLAELGALRPDEVARLRRIASGTESHPRIDPERAAFLALG
ncbi:hypothetical protein AB0G73_22020 [Streptomyces sp. NPDC020719]|uniref:hypothetical protein n=1 Tax=Streptomyces sp. NPDC020719 TaxID=3154896 RepID=UPI0033D29E48